MSSGRARPATTSGQPHNDRVEFLTALAARPADQRRAAVLQVINQVYDEPARLLRDVPPATALAAVAVVAASLPAGSGRPYHVLGGSRR